MKVKNIIHLNPTQICKVMNLFIKVLHSKRCTIVDKENPGWGLSGISYSEETDEFLFECKTLDELEEVKIST